MNQLTGYRILVVEDDIMLRHLVCSFLRAEGATIFESNDGAHALNQLAQDPVDLVISDVQMPTMNGLKMLEMMQRHGPDTPVLFLTGEAPINETTSLKLGASGFLKKPVRTTVLITKVKELMTYLALKQAS